MDELLINEEESTYLRRPTVYGGVTLWHGVVYNEGTIPFRVYFLRSVEKCLNEAYDLTRKKILDIQWKSLNLGHLMAYSPIAAGHILFLTLANRARV